MSALCDIAISKNTKTQKITHKGAWKTGDKSEYKWLGDTFSKLGLYTAVLNYRLSLVPENTSIEPATTKEPISHPLHTQDVADAINYLCTSEEFKNVLQFEPKLYLVGHSAGAQLSGSLVLKGFPLSPTCYNQIKGIIGIEGIYDIPLMVQTWPSYKDWFVVNAFGSNETVWKQASPKYMNPGRLDIPYLLLHSVNDELMDMEHTTSFSRYLIETVGCENVILDTKSLLGKQFPTKT